MTDLYGESMAAAYVRGRGLAPADIAAWMDAARPFLPAGPGRILDLGAGTGRFTAALAAAIGAAVVACEPSAAMRSACRRGCPQSTIIGGTGAALPFAAAVFDAVWVSQVVHHVPDLVAFGREVGRVLRPGGNLVLRGGFALPDGLLLHRYFPAAFHPDQTVALPALAAGFALAGLRQVAHRQVVQKLADSPEQFVARTRTRSLSNLARLPDAAFAAGMRRLDDDARRGRLPEPLAETLDLVVFRP